MRESDYHMIAYRSAYRSAYVRMCQKRNDTRKELIKKIKRADLVSNVVTRLYGNTTRANAYRDGLMDAFSIMYGDDETKLLWEYLKFRSTRVKKYIGYKLRARYGG